MDLIIGSHVTYNKEQGLVGSVKEALSYGANTYMFYTGAPQNTIRSKIDNNNVSIAKCLMKENNIDINNVIVHAPYIINPASGSDFAISFLHQEIERCNQLGINKLVLHPGNYLKLSKKEALDNIVFSLDMALNNTKEVMILLETMSGKGTELGCSFEELSYIINHVKDRTRVCVCLDTCHINDYGYDLNNPDEILDKFNDIIGLDKLKCIHINDSKNIKGSHKDRHENIGLGTIGFDNLLKFIYHEKLKNIPKILETPYVTKDENTKEKAYPPYKYEIDMIKKKKFNNNLLEDIRLSYKS